MHHHPQNSPASKLKRLVLFGAIGAVYLCSLFFYQPWRWAVNDGGDSWGYYVYLPATFIHHDLDSLHRTTEVRKQLRPNSVAPATPESPLGIGEALPVGDGKYVVKYTMGVAMMQAPFFAAAHFYVKQTGSYPATGFSKPYIFAIHVAGLCYAVLGLFLLLKTLRRFFPENTSLLTVATLAFATHLYYFCVYASVMAHAFQFFLFALAIYATVRWYEQQRLRYVLLVGAACGMVTLVRPIEIILLLVPLLFGVKNRPGFNERLQFLRSHNMQIALAALVFCSVGLPQLLYWKWTTGQFLHYSYGDEGFNFAKPQIWKGLVGYKNGWLTYTPVMWLGMAGLLLLRRYAKEWFWPVVIFVPLNIYLVYSWWCWNYINGFGSRPMVEAAAVMALPLASFFTMVAKRKWATALTAVALLAFTWLNLFQTWQFSKGLILTESGKRAFYWRMLAKTKMDYLDLVVFESGEPQPDPADVELARPLYFADFEQLSDTSAFGEKVYSGSRSLVLVDRGEKDFAMQWSKSIGELQLKRGEWVKLSVQANPTGMPQRFFEGNMLTCRFMRSKKSRKTRSIRIESKVGNVPVGIWGGRPKVWGEAYFWVKVPPFLRPDDMLQVGFENVNGKPIYLDDLRVEVWQGK
ncbi:MAG: glycosyltransferase family 39 protein [Saprospiraceae bacterium]|nr:glycosyltransferase family 39 protein [Saprospiraceae bacterium]